MSMLQDKVLIVVGGGRGVGLAVSNLCAQQGACVVVNDTGGAPDGSNHDPDVAVAAAAAIREAGGRAAASSVDGSSAEGLEELCDQALKQFGALHGAAYFAAVERERNLLRLDDTALSAVLETQLVGPFRFLRAVGKRLVEQRNGGSILLGTGVSGFFGQARQSAAAAAAGGVIGLVRSASAEWKKHRIRVNGLAPTARTRLTENLPLFRSIRSDSMTPGHVAPVAAHLLSDTARDVDGEVFGVAGGRVYGIRVSETTGLYTEGPPASLETLRDQWRTVTRS